MLPLFSLPMLFQRRGCIILGILVVVAGVLE